jgi:hypothetical protein
MDCRTARVLLDFAHPRLAELEASESKALEAHLHECPECGPLAEVESQTDDRLGRAMRYVPVPADLRNRLLTRLNAARGAWYRRRGVGLATAAALLLVATLGAWYWLSSHRTVCTPEGLAAEHNEQQGMTVDQLEDSLYQKYGNKIVLPRDLNYTYFSDCTRRELKGRLVPSLRFIREQNVAEVLVMSARQFDLEAAQMAPRAGSGGITVVFRSYASHPDFGYMIEATGGSIDWLFKVQGEPL